MGTYLKIAIVIFMLLFYIGAGFGVYYMIIQGKILRNKPASDTPPLKDYSANLQAAENFFDKKMIRDSGHINLIFSSNESEEDNSTNSEAASYYLLWNAKAGDKAAFDKELEFMRKNMLAGSGYLMWKLNAEDKAEGDGTNIASDADLRAIKALFLAEGRWGDSRYTLMIDKLADGLETIAISSKADFLPYGGIDDNGAIWKADEVWLSYSDFTAFRLLQARKGSIWKAVYERMRQNTLSAQIKIGLYNPQIDSYGYYGNGLDHSAYSVNSFWMMVRNAESGDPILQDSAKKALSFMKDSFYTDGELFGEYTSDGYPLSPMDNPWVYALTARTAVNLGDMGFASVLIGKLADKQIMEASSKQYGAIPEGAKDNAPVSQFTMQESILAMQDYQEALKSR